VRHQDKGWVSALSSGSVEVLWNRLFALISRHSAVRNLYSTGRLPYDRLQDIYSDLTQDLFLRLYMKGRWQYYIDSGYGDDNIEQELQRIEIPNLVSRILREQCPESYRLARRTSILLQTRSEFQRYDRSYSSSNGMSCLRWTRPNKKLVSQVYGLRSWNFDKPIRCEQEISELAKDVAFRKRDIRRTGRGSGSQVIISNDELSQLIFDIFTLIDSPADVRTLRQIVLSRLTIEDSRFVSIDAGAVFDTSSEKEVPQLDLPDERPTPEDALLEKEASWQAEAMAEDLLKTIKGAVRNKPQRFSKLINVVWHCYFDPARPTQTDIARTMKISASLVSHYRKIFDTYVQGLNLSVDDLSLLNIAFGERLKRMIKKPPAGCVSVADITPKPGQAFQIPNKPLAAAASAGWRR
jgi:hypothetical protein